MINMITPTTVRKIEALKALVTNHNCEVNHYSYAKFYAKHKGEIPSWGTLKKHGLITFNRTGLVLVNGINAVEANIYNFNL